MKADTQVSRKVTPFTLGDILKMISENIAILIPALNPNHKLVELIKKLNQIGLVTVVVIDDGSENSTQAVFEEVQTYQAKVYHHKYNRGKGAALRTGI